jgi:hypothetical protein
MSQTPQDPELIRYRVAQFDAKYDPQPEPITPRLSYEAAREEWQRQIDQAHPNMVPWVIIDVLFEDEVMVWPPEFT